MKPWLSKLLLGGALAIPLALLLFGPAAGSASARLAATDTRWPTATVRPTDTRWPTRTPVTPVVTTPTPSHTRWPTRTLRPTDTRWPTKTRTPTKTPTPTHTRWPTKTPTPRAASDWPYYASSAYQFDFYYPPGSSLLVQQSDHVKISLPIASGTNLVEKYLDLYVKKNPGVCLSPLGGTYLGYTIINGRFYSVQMGKEQSAGQIYEWKAYSVTRGANCISFNFVLHSANLGNYATPLPLFNKTAESAVFLAILKTVGWAPPPAPTPTQTPTPAPFVQSPSIRQVTMIDASIGWALGDAYLLRTLDGGATWTDVTPPGVNLTGVGASAYFRDANSGWLLTNLADAGPGTLYRTADGGRTWTSFDVPFAGGQMQFLDASNGFVLVSLGSGMSKQAVALYQTADGGAAWSLNYINDPNVPGAGTSLPLSGQKTGMTFRDTLHGWIGGNRPEQGFVYLYATSDSGVTWNQASLPLPSGYETAFVTLDAPVFFGNNAVLPASLLKTSATASDLFVYTSHDGGATWAASTGFVPKGELFYTDFVSPLDGFVWDWSGVLHVTHDGGATWTSITPNVDFADDLRGMDFVNMTTGWAVEIHTDNHTSLYRTTDGGRTWSLLATSRSTPTPSGPTATPSRTPTPTRTPTPGPTATLTTGPFAVVLVNANDALNIRSAAGTGNPAVGSFEYTETSVTRSGPTTTVGSDLWYQVQKPGGGTGWVNSYYLAEYVSPSTFCTDTRHQGLFDQLKQAVNNSDGASFASLVSPTHGVDVRLWIYQPAIHYSRTGVAGAFTSTTSQNWGAGPSGNDTVGTFAEIIQPDLKTVLNAPYEQYCNNPKAASNFGEPWPGPYTNFNYYSLFKPGTPGVDLDYRQWMVGIDYVRGQPYISVLIRVVWEP